MSVSMSSPTIAAAPISARLAQHLLEEAGRRLADYVGVAEVAYSSAATNGPTSSDSPSARSQKRLLLQRDQLGARHHLAEGAVQHGVGELLAEVADDHRVRLLVVLLRSREVAPSPRRS